MLRDACSQDTFNNFVAIASALCPSQTTHCADPSARPNVEGCKSTLQCKRASPMVNSWVCNLHQAMQLLWADYGVLLLLWHLAKEVTKCRHALQI